MSNSASFSDVARNLATAERGPHPESEELLSYFEGSLDQAQYDRIQEHLSLCPDCADFILEMKHAADFAVGDSEIYPEAEEALRVVRKRLGLGAPEDLAELPQRRGRSILLWAAVFALMAFGLAIIVNQSRLLDAQGQTVVLLESKLVEQQGENHSFEIMSLEPTTSLTRGPHPISARGKGGVLVLNHLASHPEATYSAELRNAQGELLWTWGNLQPTQLGNFTIRLPALADFSGPFSIDLYRIENGKQAHEASFEGSFIR